MLGYLYKKSLRKQLDGSLVSDKDEVFYELKNDNDVSNATHDDLVQWAGLFHFHVPGSYAQELRKRFKIQALERKFRKEQEPQKVREANLLFDLSSFFLNQLKEKAIHNEHLKRVVDADMIPSKLAPRMSREMRMESDIDRLPVTMANLDEICERRAEEAFLL